MDAIGQVVRDIIELKIESDNVTDDATMLNMFEWYEWAVCAGLVLVTYKYGELQGFCEWVPLKEIPESRDTVTEMVDYDDLSGPVLYVANCCIRDDGTRHGAMWKLFHMLKEKYPVYECICWHQSDGTLKIYANTKEEVMA